MKLRGFLIGILLLGCSSGCYEIRDSIDEYKIECRNKMRARSAWRRARSCYDDIDYRDDFEHGFRAGYLDVASGGDGIAPTLPPRKYWECHYQSQEGQLRTVAWFDGFGHGALAADQEGVAQWNRIITNHESRGGWQQDEWVEEEVMDPSAAGPSVPPPAPVSLPEPDPVSLPEPEWTK